MDECRAQGCDVVVGMGGGKALDTAKAVAENLGLPCVIIPTVASQRRALLRRGRALQRRRGGYQGRAHAPQPDLVLVDTGIIANAPGGSLPPAWATRCPPGFEARACKNSGARTMARGNVSNTGLMMARLCYDLLMEKGRTPWPRWSGTRSPALEDVVEATIYLSGLGFENGGLAAAHAVNDGFAQEPQAHGMYHGEKVAFGTPGSAIYWRRPPRRSWSRCSRSCGTPALPLTLAQLGVKEIVPETLKKRWRRPPWCPLSPPRTCAPISPPRRSTTPSWRPTASAGTIWHAEPNLKIQRIEGVYRMNWKEYYKQHLMSAEDAVNHIQSGNRVVVDACGEPSYLLE